MAGGTGAIKIESRRLDTLIKGVLIYYAAYRASVAGKPESFSFDERRLALEALGARIVANGREWQLEAGIPLDMDAGTLDNMLCYIPCPLQSNEFHLKGIS